MSDDESELRVLLERVVPQLPAPAQRLERVRERVRRRARRRTIALSGTTVLAVAAAGLLLPGIGGPSNAPVPQGITAPPASNSAPTAGRPTAPPSTSPPPDRLYAFSALTGLNLRLPAGWRTLTPHGSDTTYVSSQALALPPGGCAHPLDDFCTPLVRGLVPGGVLMKLELAYNQPEAGKILAVPRSVEAQPVVTACRTVGGTQQLGAMIVDGTGSGVLVTATVCLARPTDPLKARVRASLMTAAFT